MAINSWRLRAICLGVFLGSTASVSKGRLDVKTAPDGTYSILLDGVEWFAGSAPSFRHEGRMLSLQDGSLELKESIGAVQHWAPQGLKAPIFKTDVKVFDNYAVFTQSFPDGASGTATSDRNNIITSYPSLTPKWQSPKGVVSFQGDMDGSDTKAGNWQGKSGVWHSAEAEADMDTCRIVTGAFSLTSSGAGYDAWTSKLGGPGFESHAGEYCGNGKGTHAAEAFHSSALNQTACEAKCAALKCVCFDFKTGKSAHVIGGGISGTGPVVIFDSDMKTSLVLSPFSNFMAANQQLVDGVLSYGVMGGVTSIPKGYSLSTVVTIGSGVNAAMDTWGDVLLKQYGKERYAYQKDLAMQYLGYSTDNGAYYYYQTEPNKNYEDTLVDVIAYAKEQAIPYKYVLLDSWWYTKGKNSGVKTWEARPDIFPDGNTGFLKKTDGWPTQLHNRMWATDTTYAKQNGGKYNFIIDGSTVAVPDDQQFWNDLIGNKTQEAGAFMYEQDWLDTEFDRSKSIGENATLGRTWMIQMDRGAAHANQTIQMCMSHVRHILQSVEMPTVTNARASGDYHPGNGQWNTGTSSILAHAVGIGPSKDNYWSTAVQNGTHYGTNTKEPHSRLQSAVSTLTNGPVAPSDMIGGSDAALIMRCCDTGGRLLSADRPATEIDAHFAYLAGFAGVNGHLWSTFATVSGQRFSYAIGISLLSAYALKLTELGYDSNTSLLAVKADATAAVPFSSSAPLAFQPCGLDDFQLYLIAPQTGQYTLLGESDKWISVSSQRFSSLASSGAASSVTVHGQAGEHVQVRWSASNGHISTATCILSEAGLAESRMSASGATCSSTFEIVV